MSTQTAAPSEIRESPVDAAHRRARERGVRPLFYRFARALLWPFAMLALRPRRFGRDFVPREGAVILACNHRSMLDPFVVGLFMRRPMHFVAKAELFDNRVMSRLLPALGGIPVRRGSGDRQMLATALAVLRRGGCLMIFPEGTRSRGATLGTPLRGVGRMAVATNAQVVPVAIAGTGAGERNLLRPVATAVAAAPPRVYANEKVNGVRADQAAIDDIWADVNELWESLRTRGVAGKRS